MLQITDSAADVITQVRAQNDLPQEAVLRIELVAQEGQGQGIGFSFTSGPEEGDQPISERDDLTVYLSQELTDPLAGAVLDARPTEQGVQLELRDRGTDHSHGHDDDHEGHQH